MNTQPRSHTLPAGQAMLLPARAASAVLVQGEVLLQAPSTWLAGRLVVPAAVRIAAPAMLPTDTEGTVFAVHDAVVAVQEAPSLRTLLAGLVARLRTGRITRQHA
ncbi:hypothetical protein [Ramlibacter pallidus]|uniref:DUF2917 domain-containing protein n=1 Tax=Ramlibacter pallidus TaxID=2780087 RepID=A0ABR9S267_9BURK|nr:hypothetical protein [Ramlibacter pallidus]MBE7367142.1 hypothetical protein [Ramlibacter pallidus]